MNLKELYWAAGFLEGEGSFGRCSGPARNNGQLRITCHQVEKEPLIRLKALFGGLVMGPHRTPTRPIHLWSLQYRSAVGAMMTLYPLMSMKRKSQIRAALDYWKSFSAHRGTWTHCASGHELSGDNLRVDKKSGKRRCRTCHRRHVTEFRKRKLLKEAV